MKLFEPVSALRRDGCPGDVIAEAAKSAREVAKIMWDEPDIPEHCKGYVQWSVRPYRVTDRCDGTRDANAMVVCREFCESTGIDLESLYREAFPGRSPLLDAAYTEYLDGTRAYTEIPDVTQENIKQLLDSLYSMNWRSLVELLTDAWSAQGYAVHEYWNH